MAQTYIMPAWYKSIAHLSLITFIFSSQSACGLTFSILICFFIMCKFFTYTSLGQPGNMCKMVDEIRALNFSIAVTAK